MNNPLINDRLIPIRKAAEILGVSLDTLRRWDKSGKFPAIKSPGGHRFYSSVQIELYRNDLFALAKRWVTNEKTVIPSEFYCQTSIVFQDRVAKMGRAIYEKSNIDWFSLLVSAAGEIGNNSFDHNLGNWPDIPGIFFGYDTEKRIIILADRGQGVLTTLRRVKPELTNDKDALQTAFTQILSGRSPEARGNGLKFVKSIIDEFPLSLEFFSGEAKVVLLPKKEMVFRQPSGISFHGCLAYFKY